MDETDTEVTGRCDCPLVEVSATVAEGSKGELVDDDDVVVAAALASRALRYPLWAASTPLCATNWCSPSLPTLTTVSGGENVSWRQG